MYYYVEDKELISNMRGLCSDIVNQLVQLINGEGKLKVKASLVGSGAKNLITQNENEPIDLDYNLSIKECNEFDINDSVGIKEYVRKSFNIILKRFGWNDCKDSTSALTTEKRYFKNGNQTKFSIDLCIIYESNQRWWRLIHQKTGFTNYDRWYWSEGKHSGNLKNKADWLKKNGHWNEVREVYLEKKNMYLRKNDKDHPSFICYLETINEICNKYKNKR